MVTLCVTRNTTTEKKNSVVVPCILSHVADAALHGLQANLVNKHLLTHAIIQYLLTLFP